MSFQTSIAVRWSDVDHNQHVRHSAYYDYGAHCRIQFFDHINFGMNKLSEMQLGPVLFSEQCNFLRELKLNEIVRVNLLRGEVSANGRKWVLYHEMFNGEDEKVAHLRVFGAWMDVSQRKITAPPAALAEAFLALDEGKDYIHGA